MTLFQGAMSERKSKRTPVAKYSADEYETDTTRKSKRTPVANKSFAGYETDTFHQLIQGRQASAEESSPNKNVTPVNRAGKRPSTPNTTELSQETDGASSNK